jgi:FlaA1/EpsC-like NDP-sugar epimerase
VLFKTIESTIGKVLDEYTHQHVSRSIILAIDVIIVATSYILSVILRYNFNLDEIPVDRYLAHFVIIVLIRSLFFLYQKSYYGIIRHTSLQDVRLLFYNITYSSLCILVISLFLDQLIKTSHLYIPLSIILIDYFICLFLLIASRMFVKSIYSDIIKGRHNVYGQPILIYGAGSLGILTKNSLLNEESKYKIIGFIDDNESLVGKTVHGIEVFELEQALMRFISSTSKQPQVIVAIKNIDLNRRKQLAE